MRAKASAWGMILSIALLVLLAACGKGAVLGSTPPATPSPVPARAQQCGTIMLSPLHKVEDAGLSQKAGDCFWNAYQQCKPASLVLSVGGLDTITRHNFSVGKQSANCAVSDMVQHSIAPNPPRTTGTYLCSGMSYTGGELRIQNCGPEGTIAVPVVGMQ